MRRRDFIKAFAVSALTAGPLTARAQQPERVRRIGVVFALGENDPVARGRVRAFRLGLRDLGWVEGRNLQIEYRFSGTNSNELINQNVADLIQRAPEVIVGNSTPVLAALRSATSTIPIVFVVVNDPVGQGFISSLARPGGNITGFSFVEPEIVGKWIDLLSDVKPNLSRVALMFNPVTAPFYDDYLQALKASPRRDLVKVEAAHVRSIAEIELAIANLGREPGSGLMVGADSFVLAVRGAIAKAADEHGLPVISPYRQFVAEGSLMSYGPDTDDIFRRSSSYVDRILKGEAPSSMPAQSPIKFELVINLKTARTLGLTVQQPFLLLADEVIE
jgi:putative tryptophan/tyrosine transport system substrate-binding protein